MEHLAVNLSRNKKFTIKGHFICIVDVNILLLSINLCNKLICFQVVSGTIQIIVISYATKSLEFYFKKENEIKPSESKCQQQVYKIATIS